MELAYSADFGEVHEAVRARLRATRWWPLMRWTAYGAARSPSSSPSWPCCRPLRSRARRPCWSSSGRWP